MLDLIEAIKSPATPPEDRIHLGRRIRLELEFLSQVLENHRDQEESVLFVTLHSQRPELGPTLDQMGEEHVRIFRNLRTISEEADQLGLDPGPTADALSGFIPSLRGFIEELWKHTIDEETMLHRCRQEQRGPGPDRSDQIRDV